MGVQGARSYLAAFASLGTLADADERRRVARQGLAALAQIAEREPAPLEGIAPDALLASVRTALEDGVLADLEWMSPAAGALAMFELAQALPAGPERRELGRRVLVRLRDADRDSFVRLVVALARSAPKLVASDSLRARTEVVLSAPLTRGAGAIGELALGLCAQPSLASSWIEEPATGSLPARRLAARILAHAAREALRRHDAGDRGGVAIMVRPGIRAAIERLLGDREALVWRFAAIARGLLAHVDLDLAAAIDRELRPNASSTELRRGAASAAAALERGGAALRWAPVIVARTAKDPGVARGAILGLAGLAVNAPSTADDLAHELVQRAPLDGAEALVDLRREEDAPLLPTAAAFASAWAREQLHGSGTLLDDGRSALLHALDVELGDLAVATSSDATASKRRQLSSAQLARDAGDVLREPLANARAALDAGDVTRALREARIAVDELAAAADWLERATDDDPIDRRHSMRLLRELDREVLADNVLAAVIALAPEGDPTRTQYTHALGAIEAALLAREATPEGGPVAHGGLRIARLRALVRLLDGVRGLRESARSGRDGVTRDGGPGGLFRDSELAPRLATVRTLMARASADHSPLRRAVWAAMTRAGDALLRDDLAEITDLLLAWTWAFPDDDFAIVREASMIPDVTRVFEAYARLQAATWAAADPDDTGALHVVVERWSELADALPPEQSRRVEAVRLALARIGNLAARITAATSRSTIPDGAFEELATELAALARRVYGAHQRLGIEATEREADLDAALRSIGGALRREAHDRIDTLALADDTPAQIYDTPRNDRADGDRASDAYAIGRAETRERMRARRDTIRAADRARAERERTRSSSHPPFSDARSDTARDATQPMAPIGASALSEASATDARDATSATAVDAHARDAIRTRPRGMRESQARELFRDAIPLDEAIAIAIDATRAVLPAALAAAVERVLLWIARRPRAIDASATPPTPHAMLPSWVPLSRQLGGFHVVRPIGRGAGGSVLLACRVEERAHPDKELVALKTPDYSGGAARNLSEAEFEALFRDEAGALLAVPAHPNLAGFVTFDATARPKPILVMEYVRGTNLERALEQNALDMLRACAIIDDLLAGLGAMHEVSVAHLDVKPANIVLRAENGVAVLVDFGLAGRRLRTGCGSPHYGAREVWAEGATDPPFFADVYAAACVAFEVLTNTVLVRGDSLNDVIANHFSKQPAADVLAQLAHIHRLGPLSELLRAALSRDSSRRPTAARLRAGFAAIAPELREMTWPIEV
ncbi:MAG: protein kinase domain-containing protein [Kofleriaceae bacterium]